MIHYKRIDFTRAVCSMAKGIQQRDHQPFLCRKLAIASLRCLNENSSLDSLG
jgi:hypothetical protein